MGMLGLDLLGALDYDLHRPAPLVDCVRRGTRAMIGAQPRTCPRDGAAATSWCKCHRADTKYACGHEYHVCLEHKILVEGPSDHSRSGCSCRRDIVRNMIGVGVDWGDPAAVDRLTADFRAKLDQTPITYSIAKKIADQGIDLTRKAESAAKANPKSVLGPAMWETPRGHVQWHLDNMARDIGARPATATPYERADDLKKWVTSSYRAMLASVSAKELQEQIDAEFWRGVVTSLADLPENMRIVVKRTVGEVTGVPWWLWTGGGVVLLGALGYGAFKILHAAAPAVGRVAAERYLPGGR